MLPRLESCRAGSLRMSPTATVLRSRTARFETASLSAIANKLEVLDLLAGAGHLQALPPGQLEAGVMLPLNAYSNGIFATTIFWGLWLLPFGYLVFKSGFLPRVLGILLIIGGFGILTDMFGRTLFPRYAETPISTFLEMSSSFGEIGICLWLLIFGARKTFRAPGNLTQQPREKRA